MTPVVTPAGAAEDAELAVAEAEEDATADEEAAPVELLEATGEATNALPEGVLDAAAALDEAETLAEVEALDEADADADALVAPTSALLAPAAGVPDAPIVKS